MDAKLLSDAPVEWGRKIQDLIMKNRYKTRICAIQCQTQSDFSEFVSVKGLQTGRLSFDEF